MNRKKYFELNEELHTKIISVAYGESSLAEKIQVLRAASKNKTIRDLLNSYTQTANAAKQIREEECPEEILNNNAEIQKIISSNRNSRFMQDLYSILFARPLVSAVASFVIVAAIVVSLIVNKPIQYSYKYSNAEIVNADQKARLALLIIGKIFKDTQTNLQNEILRDMVAKPINNGIGIVNNILEGELK